MCQISYLANDKCFMTSLETTVWKIYGIIKDINKNQYINVWTHIYH